MGLLATIADALGLRKAIRPQEAGPFALDSSVAEALAAAPEGHALHVRTAAAERGRLVHAWLAPATPTMRRVDELPVVISDEDLQRLHGLRMVHREQGFAVSLDLVVRAGSTPNPDGRLYTISRPLHRGAPSYYTAQGPPAPPPVDALLARPDVEAALLRGAHLTLTRSPGASWKELDAAVDSQLRDHFLGCGELVDGDVSQERTDPLAEEVRLVLQEQVLPGVHRDGGHIELVDVREGVVRVHLEGACSSCPAATSTLRDGVERALRRSLGSRVVRVEQV